MRIRRILELCLVGCSVSMIPAVTMGASATSAPCSAARQGTNTVTPSAELRSGERVFKQNCSRCHEEPQGFSPSISGTIVRHMRIRASLSRDDERAVLKFLNP
jgi:cytochrome c5